MGWQGIGPKALALLLALLRDDASIALVGVSTSVENASARRAFEKAGFRVSRQYSPPGFGACYLLLASLRRESTAEEGIDAALRKAEL